MPYTTGRFSVDELQFIQSVPVRVLVAATHSEIDLNLLAREELANRGYDAAGVWIGFRRAQDELRVWKGARTE
jgi:hypothetical protein